MGKKVKKDEKPPADDVFDALQLETRQAGTVVLMLESPEDEIQAKACESIYRFVEKGDENKKQLLDLGCMDPLLRLMQSEDRIVRRNACMAVGSMTGHGDVRRILRKKEETIPAFVALLSPEEETIVHEFAALGLCNMATEYSSKAAIFESNGIEPLVKCLSSADPDVQKNAIEAVAQMMLDYQTRAAIKDAEGLNPILELLKSDYSIIQKLALLALDRASQDTNNRAALRELETITKLIDFVAHPEWNDLHVMAVMVMSNLLEDVESLEQIKESGGLKKLVALITDQPPPDDDIKGGGGGKPEKKGGSRAAKKSAKDSKKAEPDREDTPAGEAIIPTLPDVKMCAAKAIARSARNGENRKILHEQETEKMLIHLLGHESPDVQSAAALAIGIMCENLTCKDAIREWEGLQPLIKLMSSDNGDVKEAVTLALANLTSGNSSNCNEMSNLNGVDILIHILSDPRDEAVANAACVLTNLAQEEVVRVEVQGRGIVPALIGPLKSQNKVVQSKAALAVAAFVCDFDTRTEFRGAEGLEHLVRLLHSGNEEVRRNASWAIAVCAVDELTSIEICKLGCMEILQDIQMSGTRRNPFAEAALDRLLDSNLSAKYALKGHLSSLNNIENGFYDAGQLRPQVKFLSLEEYGKQEMNDKRPIILVNAKTEPYSATSQSNIDGSDLKQDSSRASVTSKASKTGRESKSKTKAQKDKEDKQREEEIHAQLQRENENMNGEDSQPFVAPADPTLVKFIEEVTEKIQPLSTTKTQVSALAAFVSDKMGGPIDRGQVANFSWELPLSQIKFEMKSNVIPLGKIKSGIHTHRALLFKVLADRIAVGCTLTRGDYNRAWNEVLLPDGMTDGVPKFPPKAYIIDLVHEPGKLMNADSPEALSYQKI
ncbi:hypothetical protein ScPMuIL_009989 [Solemya velum]